MPRERWREYRYRKVFGLTHDQYLDEPAETIDWLLKIDDAVREAEAESRQTKASPGESNIITRPL
jgi:hypothetical protein